jgi:hypothetical protein
MTSRRDREALARRLKEYRDAQRKGVPYVPPPPTPVPTEAEKLAPLNLPSFPYHRDPVANGAIIASGAVCVCCQQARGAICKYSDYCMGEPLCPWCIADGTAFDRFQVYFQQARFGDAEGNRLLMPTHFYRDVFGRTVGFFTYNPFTWWVHCDEPAEYVTRNEPYDLVFECRQCGMQQIIEDWD